MSSSVTAAAAYAATVSIPAFGTRPKGAESKSHHTKDGFQNPWDSFLFRRGLTIPRALISRRLSGRANVPDTQSPDVPFQKAEFLPTRETKALRVTWLGHACSLVEFPSGLRVLFDPVFSDRCSPFTFMGPKRYTKPPCDVGDIPIVDAVVISHSHYDHLDHPTVLQIVEKHPKAHFFVPLKNKQWFIKCGIDESRVTELDWWEEAEIKVDQKQQQSEVRFDSAASSTNEGDSIQGRFGCLPCQHMSGRTPFDMNRTLWSSWSVESGGKKIWFGGDTGYRTVPELADDEDDYARDLPHCPAFKDIGDLRGPFDLGLIPIGAYAPRFIMSPMHCNPFDSVNVFKDTKCKRAIGIHWGTWVLTEEDVLEPPKVLRKAMTAGGLSEEGIFDVCGLGESTEYP